MRGGWVPLLPPVADPDGDVPDPEYAVESAEPATQRTVGRRVHKSPRTKPMRCNTRRGSGCCHSPGVLLDKNIRGFVTSVLVGWVSMGGTGGGCSGGAEAGAAWDRLAFANHRRRSCRHPTRNPHTQQHTCSHTNSPHTHAATHATTHAQPHTTMHTKPHTHP